MYGTYKSTIGIYSAGIENAIRLAEKAKCYSIHYDYTRDEFQAEFGSEKDRNEFFDAWVSEFGFREDN